MAVYNLFDVVEIYAWSEEWNNPTDLWEISEGKLITTAPFTATTPSSSQFDPYFPFPYLSDLAGQGTFNLSAITETGDTIEIMAKGKITANPIISRLEVLLNYATITGEEDGFYLFEVPYSSIYVEDSSNVYLGELRLQYFSNTALPLTDVEFELEFYIRTSGGEQGTSLTCSWEVRSLQEVSSCNYQVATPQEVTVKSSILRVYPFNTIYDRYGECVDNILVPSQEPTLVEDVTESTELVVSGDTISLLAWSHPEVERDTKFSLEVEVDVVIDGTVYATRLTAVNPESA